MPIQQLTEITPEVAVALDRLGEIKAMVAKLEGEAKAIKNTLISYGPGTYESELFRATVSSYNRDQLDLDAVRAHLSPQFIAAHTTTTLVTVVRLTARNPWENKTRSNGHDLGQS